MDIIAEAKMLVDDLALPDKVFSEGLGFKAERYKSFNRYTMDSHGQILVYADYDMWRLPHINVNLITTPEKIARVARILEQAKSQYIYNERKEDGIVSTLEWAPNNSAGLRLESFEDSYWVSE